MSELEMRQCAAQDNTRYLKHENTESMNSIDPITVTLDTDAERGE